MEFEMADVIGVVGLALCVVGYGVIAGFKSDKRYKTGYKYNQTPRTVHWKISVLCWTFGICLVVLANILNRR